MTQLYRIADEYRETLDSIMDEDGCIDETAIEKLNSITEDLNKKGVAMAQFMSNIDADLQAIKAEKERLAKRQATLESRVKWMNEYLKGNMERCGIQAISCPYFTIKIKKSPHSVQVDDESQISENYVKTKVTKTLDKAQMRRDMQDGAEIPGARLVQGTWLDIR